MTLPGGNQSVCFHPKGLQKVAGPAHRMADFALWATAAEPGLGLRPGEFLAAYRENRETANEAALESSPVARYVLQVAEEGDWHGTPSELLEHIETLASDGDKRGKTWPKRANGLSGILKRLAPNLREAGVGVEFGSEGRGRRKRRTIAIRKSTDYCVPTAPSPGETGARGDDGDDSGPCGDDAGTQTAGDVTQSGATAGTMGTMVCVPILKGCR